MERERSYELFGVSSVILLGFFLRLVTARYALVPGGIQLYGYDSFYHMRRIFYTAKNFPHTLWFDSYLNHPVGLEITWPPLFDQLVAAVSLLFGGSPRAVEAAGAVVPPILGSATILLLYLLAKKLFGMRVALLSAFLLAIDMKHIGRSFFGLPDHDVLVLLLILGAILLIAYALTEKDRWLMYAVSAGVLIAAAAYTWLGTPIFMIAFLTYAGAQIALDLKEGRSSYDTIHILVTVFGIALLLLLPFWDEAWLIPSAIGVLGSLATLAFLYLLSRLFLAMKIPWQAFAPITAIFIYIFLISIYYIQIMREIGLLIWAGFSYFFGSTLERSIIEEAMPLFRVYEPVSLPVLSILLALIGLIIMIRSIRPLRKDHLLFLVWTGFSMALAMSQTRFLFFFSISVSVLVALLFFWGEERIRDSIRFQKYHSENIKRLAIAVLLLVFILPSVANLSILVNHKPDIAENWNQSLDWLGDNTPSTKGFGIPVQAGDYGVLSWWDYGNWILYKSRRPVASNNFQAGAEDAANFLLSENEDEAFAIADARNIRYIITDMKMLSTKLNVIARWIEEDPRSYVDTVRTSDKPIYRPNERLLGTSMFKLHIFDCTNLSHFRLIYESKNSSEPGTSFSEVKIFERVPGVKIAGTTSYNEPIIVELEMTTNQGRFFKYFNSAIPVDGHYEITVPYSTEDRYETHSIGPYMLKPVDDEAGRDVKKIEVNEEDVLNGGRIEVNF